MSGETDLDRLLASLSPSLVDGEFVFCTFADARYGDLPELAPVAAVSEPQGLTLVVPRANADARELAYESIYRMITLGVHSSLDAVGLTAAIAARLAARGISANVIAGYHHDHIFVPRERADEAVTALEKLAR